MSLESGGSSFTVKVSHRAIKTTTFDSYTPKASPEDLKTAFMQVMKQFVDSAEFAEATYELENNIQISVHHSINLRMPS
jgi:hypothetical protein